MRAIVRIVAGFLLMVTTSHLFPASAQAESLDVECVPPSSSVVTYNPPLTNEPQPVNVNISAQYGPCKSLSKPTLTSGTYLSSGKATRSCVELLTAGSVIFTITWNTGQTSTLSGNRVTNIVGATLVVTTTGTVTAGLFAGDTFVNEAAGPATDIVLCTLGLGTVSSVYSELHLTITSV